MKKLVYTLFMMLVFQFTEAQPVLNWQGTAGTSAPIRVTATFYDEANNLYIGGYFQSAIDLDFGSAQSVLTPVGSYDGFIAKYNVFGELQWARRIGGLNEEQVNGMVVSGGIIYVCGNFTGTATFNAPNTSPQLTSSGGSDIFIARYSASDGQVFTPYRIGGSNNEEGIGIKSDASGNIYLHGILASASVNFSLLSGSTLLSSSGGNDGFIAKYDGSLALQWARVYGGGIGTNDVLHDIDIDQNGFVYAAGEFGGTSNFNNGVSLATTGLADGFVIKLNSSGNTLWGRRIGGASSNDIIRGLKLDGKGSLYMGGTFAGTNINLNPNGTAINFTTQGGIDGFIAKLDTNVATATWIRQLGGTGADLVLSIAVDTLSQVYASGSFTGTAAFPVGSTSTLTGVGGEDAFFIKVNGLGTMLWSYRYGDVGNDLGRSVSVSKNGNHFFTGGQSGGQLFALKLGECADAAAINGPVQICNTSAKSYTIPTVVGATSYLWTLPAGWSGSSTSNSISVTPNSSSGTISVKPVTSCGMGLERQLFVRFAFDTLDKNLVRHWLADSADSNRDRISSVQLSLTNTVKDTDRFSTPDAAYRISNNTGFIGTGGNLPTGNSTIAFWYYYQSNGQTNNVLLGSNSSLLPNGHPLLLITNNDGRLFPWSNAGTAIGAGTVITQNTWNHIALVRNGSSFVLYINGINAAEGSNLSIANFERLGNNRPGFETQGATGKFDDIRIYNIQLTAAQIQNIYEFGQVRRLNLSQLACAGSTLQQSISFSTVGMNYSWFKNTQPVGANSQTYANTFAVNDTLIQVRVENQCIFETFSKTFVVGNSVTGNVSLTTCSAIKIGDSTYFKTGQYTAILKRTTGCDSIINLNLTVNKANAFNRNQGMIHYWPLNSRDSSTNYKGLTLLNHSGLVTPTTDRNGNIGSAYNISGTNRSFIPETAINNPDLTIAFWFNRTSALSGTLLANQNNALLTLNANGTLTYNGNTSTFILAQNQWYHIVYTNNLTNNGLASIYINGQLVIAQSGTIAPITRIGNLTNGSSPARGLYDDFMVFNYALNANETDSLRLLPTLINTDMPSSYSTACGYVIKTGLTNKEETLVELYKNNQLLANDTFAAVNSFSVLDTTITYRLLSSCMRIDYTKRISVSPEFDTVVANACGSYSYNNKNYIASGTYQDTIIHFPNCSTYVTLIVNINDTNTTRVSQNGLIRYWNANANSLNRDIVNDDTLSFIGTGIAYTGSRTLAANSALSMTGITSVIRTNIPPLSVGTISFYYFHVASSTTKVLLGSNATSLPDGHPLLVVVNNNLNVWSNTGSGNPTVVLANNSWNHIVLVRNGGNYKLYVNNVLVNSGTNLSPANFDRLGNNRPGAETQGAAGGSFDDIFIYNRELNETEISLLSTEQPMLSLSKPLAACVGSNVSVRSQFQFAGGWRYSIWRGNTKLSDTTFAIIPSITLGDTSSIVIRSFSNCRTVEYPVRLNISNQTADLNQGLVRFWTMKNTENRNSLTNGQSPYSLTGNIGSNGSLGRNNIDSNGAVQITDKNNQWINTDLTTTELQNGQPYTVSFWFNSTFTNQGAEEGILLSNSNAGSVAMLQLSTSNQLQLLNNTGQAIFSSTSIPAGVWQHIVYANNGNGYYKLILNGQLASEGWGAIPTLRPERIGNGRPGLTNRGARGRYDDIMIYNRVLSNSEALVLYNLPVIIESPLSIATCNNNATNFVWNAQDTTPVSYTFIRNNSTNITNSTANTFVVTPTDTVVGLQIDKACATIRLTSRITKNVTNLNIALERFWTMNAKDVGNSLTALSENSALLFTRREPTSMIYSNGRTGAARAALTWNGKNGSIDLGIGNFTNVTVSFWHRPNVVFGAESARALLGSSTSSILNIDVSTGNLNLRALGTVGNYIGTSYALTAGVWYHIVFIRNGTNYEVYVNDTLRLSGTGINQANIQHLGNSAGFTFGATGFYDDVAIYSRAIVRNEVTSLFTLPTIIEIPDTSVICAGASRNFGFNIGGGNSSATYQLTKSSSPNFTPVTVVNANGTSGSTTVTNGDRIALIQTVGCTQMQYNFYPKVQGTTAAGPTLNYNATTKVVSVSSSFNQVRLFRNGTLVFTNTLNGNINYTNPFRCGTFTAEYITTGSVCPSVSPVLNVTPSDTFNRNVSLCSGSTLNFGSLSITTAGTYIQTFVGVVGNCDSTVRLTVTTGQPTSSSVSRIGCGSLTIFGKTFTQSGVYKDTILNTAGCDSVITLNLTINNGGPIINTLNITACNQYILNGKTYSQSGSYRDTLIGASTAGCDSILVLNLVLNNNGSTQNIVACKSYLFKGITLTQSGVYYDTLTNVSNCDSIITLNLTINTINVGVTKIDNTLTSNETGASYQWINCATNLIIPGATMASYTPISSGTFKVVILKNNCTDTSVCYPVNIVSCNVGLSFTNLTADTVRCKQIRVHASNVALPITLNISWPANPVGVNAVINDSVRVYSDVCPDTYTIKLTDANNCKDTIVFTISEPVGLPEISSDALFLMYPNPANSWVELVFTNISNRKISITDGQGKTWLLFTSTQRNERLDVSSLSPGLYFIKLEDETGIHIKKFIKQ